MATTKPLPLYSLGDVARSLAYLRDPLRESHVGYSIESTDVGTDSEFLAKLDHDFSWIQAEVPIAHRPKIRAHWVFANFEKGAFLTSNERDFVARTLADGLSSRWHRSAWHVQEDFGCCDFNLILPSVQPGLMPTLRRFVVASLWCISRSLLERAVALINVGRARENRSPLPDIREIQLKRALVDGMEIASLLAEAAKKTHTRVTVESLPTLLANTNVAAGDWLITDRYLFLRRRGKKSCRVDLNKLIEATTRRMIAPLEVSVWEEFGPSNANDDRLLEF